MKIEKFEKFLSKEKYILKMSYLLNNAYNSVIFIFEIKFFNKFDFFKILITTLILNTQDYILNSMS